MSYAHFMWGVSAASGAMGGYYYILWRVHGGHLRPKMGWEVEPPLGLSPAAMRYLWLGRFDADCLVAGLLAAALAGACRITWQAEGFTLWPMAAAPAALPPDLYAALTYHNGQPLERLHVGKARSRAAHHAEDRMHAILSRDHDHHMVPRWRWWLGGVAASCVLLLLCVRAWLPVVWLNAFVYVTIGVVFVLIASALAWEAWAQRNRLQLAGALLFGLCGLATIIAAEYNGATIISPGAAVLAAVNVVGAWHMPRYTRTGARLQARIGAFRQFLMRRVASGQPWQPHEQALLPYLVALEVDFQGSAYFRHLLTQEE